MDEKHEEHSQSDSPQTQTATSDTIVGSDASHETNEDRFKAAGKAAGEAAVKAASTVAKAGGTFIEGVTEVVAEAAKPQIEAIRPRASAMAETAGEAIGSAAATAGKVFNKATVWGRRAGVFALGLLAGLGIGAILIGTGVLGWTFHQSEPIADNRTVLTLDVVESVVNQASDLTTTKYCYKNAATFTNAKSIGDFELPGTQSTFVYTYEGVIGLGIDLSSVSYKIDNDARTITVSMPEIMILFHELDENSFEFVYENNSVLAPTDLSDASAMREEQKQAMAEKVLSDKDLLATAENNARTVLTAFLTNAEATAEYKVIYE